mgnify:CR=1 FL=1
MAKKAAKKKKTYKVVIDRLPLDNGTVLVRGQEAPANEQHEKNGWIASE